MWHESTQYHVKKSQANNETNVMLHMKTRLIDITCICVKKQTGPTQPSHVSQL